MKVVFSGGGTLGHVTPLEAIHESLDVYLRGQGDTLDALFVGQAGGAEDEYLNRKGYRFIGISAGKLRRYFSIENVFDAFRFIIGIYQSLWIIITEKPDVIMSKGGFVSLPVAIAGAIWRVPVVLHESDSHMGLANKIASRFATRVCVAFPNTTYLPSSILKKVVVTGNPVRPSALDASREAGLGWLDFSGDRPIVSFIGGSAGASVVNEAVGVQLAELTSFCDVFLQCGKGKELDTSIVRDFESEDSSRGRFRQAAFVDDIASVMMASDLCVIRGGANSLLDVTIYGVAAISVPLPTSAGNHQYLNVKALEEQGACVLYEQSRIDADGGVDFVATIGKILHNPQHLALLRENALRLRHIDGAQKICEVITGVM